jgi:hypothetical protein
MLRCGTGELPVRAFYRWTVPERSPEAAPDDRRRSLGGRRISRDALTSAGLCAFALCLVLIPLGLNIRDATADSLLEYREDGLPVTVRTNDGCLTYRKERGGRAEPVTEKYCGWQRPEGAAERSPRTREWLVLDAARTHVVEVVAFGTLPDETRKVRYTLPGGEVVEPAVRRRDDLDQPAFWIHLTDVAIPVDLAVVGGEPVFQRFQIFEAAGHEIATV